jgi:hypothetical protein
VRCVAWFVETACTPSHRDVEIPYCEFTHYGQPIETADEVDCILHSRALLRTPLLVMEAKGRVRFMGQSKMIAVVRSLSLPFDLVKFRSSQ